MAKGERWVAETKNEWAEEGRELDRRKARSVCICSESGEKMEKRVEKSADGGFEVLNKVGEVIGSIAVGCGGVLTTNYREKRRRVERTLLLLSPENIAVPSDKAPDFYSPFQTNDSGQTPAKEHSKFVRTSKSSILTPMSLGGGESKMVGACGSKGRNELFDDIGPNVDSKRGE
jgi:hypothetical protein